MASAPGDELARAERKIRRRSLESLEKEPRSTPCGESVRSLHPSLLVPCVSRRGKVLWSPAIPFDRLGTEGYLPCAVRHPLLSRDFLASLAVQMAFGVSYSSFLLLPKYLRVELHASAADIGMVNGIGLVFGTLVAPFIGLSSRQAKRTTLVALSLLLQGLSGLGFLLAKEVGPLMYLLRIMQGFAWVTIFNCTATIVADIVPPSRSSQAIGVLGVSMLCTNALAPAVAEPIAEAFGWHWVFVPPAIIALAAVFGALRLPEPPLDEPRAMGASLKNTVSGPLLAVYYASALMGAGIAVMFTFAQPYALSLGSQRVGPLFFGYVGAAVLVRVALSWLADRLGPERIATVALVLYAITVTATSGLEPATMLLLGAGLGVSHGFLYPALAATGLSSLSRNEKNVFMGWLTASFNAGFALAALGLGPVVDRFGYAIVFWIVGGLLATGVVPMALAAQSVRRAATQG